MIFVAVGTDEHPFDRLVKFIDSAVGSGYIKEKVVMQTGHSTVEPAYCEYKRIMPFDEMIGLIRDAEIVITHGGPGLIIQTLSFAKIPIVVPRQKRFNEHVDDHQVLFVKRLEKEKKVIAIYELGSLLEAIVKYSEIIKDYNYQTDKTKTNKTSSFALELDGIIDELFRNRN
ncbi:MAG: glycosyltransferase [Bacillota bacterium]